MPAMLGRSVPHATIAVPESLPPDASTGRPLSRTPPASLVVMPPPPPPVLPPTPAPALPAVLLWLPPLPPLPPPADADPPCPPALVPEVPVEPVVSSPPHPTTDSESEKRTASLVRMADLRSPLV